MANWLTTEHVLWEIICTLQVLFEGG